MACSEAPSSRGDASTDTPPDVTVDTAGETIDATTEIDTAQGTADATAEDDPRPRLPVRFALQPGWAGVVAVAVYGSFGRANDWMAPFVTLTRDGDTWRGNATLPPGTYSYLFRVTGDAQAGPRASSYTRDVHDPSNLRSGLCAAGSAPALRDPRMPCSILFVPQSDATPTRHAVTGRALLGTMPAAGWLAIIERHEPNQSAAFTDRVTVDTDGRFTLRVAVGQYRVSLLHPTALANDDRDRAPLAEHTARRAFTIPFFVSADVLLPTVDLSMRTYEAHQPRGAVALPVRFVFAAPSGSTARAAVYGPAHPDPWWTSEPATTMATWDGRFSFPGAPAMATAGTRYTWGTLADFPRPTNAPTSWTLEGATFPLTLH